LDISVSKLEKVIYYAAYIVTSVNEEARTRVLKRIKQEFKVEKVKEKEKKAKKVLEETELHAEEIVGLLRPGLILSEQEYYSLAENFGDVFEADRGAEAIRKILELLDFSDLTKSLKKELEEVKDPMREKRLLYRLRLVRSLAKANIRPEWLILTQLPVLPPELRPMVALDGGRYATADLNDLYRRVINRNNRLKKLIELHSPEVIIVNEKRMLQEAVDALIDNSARLGSQMLSTRRRPLRSLADMLKGKQGRFRQNLLGKRVDYSGRSVIVVGPELKINECGLPKKMALELFRPFVINQIIERNLAYNIKQANRLIEQGSPEIWAILEEVIEHRKVLLNRAPTLHRLGIQAFKPVLIEDLAIRIPPLVCAAFNADFDGDQMAVHLPLTLEAQYEAHNLMDAGKNLLKPANGDPIVSPTQDMVLGCYFLTKMKIGAKGEGKIFSDFREATLAYEEGHLDIHAKIKLFINKKLEETSYGRIVFNQIFPPDFGFVNDHLNKKALSRIVTKIIDLYGIEETHNYLDRIKNLGYSYATLSSITWGMNDTIIPKEKKEIVLEGEKEVELIESQFNEGLLTNEERKQRVIDVWTAIREKIAILVPKNLDVKNPVHSIIDSGARGSWGQTNQMMGMRGLVDNPKGETIELPIKSSYKEGLNILEYFIATHGARKGTTDTALKTASAGYLTRRLVDVSQDLIIREEDCKTTEGLDVLRSESGELAGYGYTFAARIYSRTALEDIKVGKRIVVRGGEVIGREAAKTIENSNLELVKIRTPIRCKTSYGVCAACYGWDLSKNEKVALGEVVGIVAAQSIGEPGTQLTMRTFHVGGVAGVDITHGLPRVEEIFEARPPKGKAFLAKSDGVVSSIENRGALKIIKIKGSEPENKKKKTKKSSVEEYLVPMGINILVKEGEKVSPGHPLTEGPFDLREIYDYKGRDAVEKYVIDEVQKIYVREGAFINNKHIEIIVRQMFSRVTISDAGDTEFMVGEVVEKSKFVEANREIKRLKKTGAKAIERVLGITRVALSTESFLSAASFQETSRVLVNAAIEGKVDKLRGLKENVIIGKLIPVMMNKIPEDELRKLKEKLAPKPIPINSEEITSPENIVVDVPQ
ncbi:MAG: DNA-directed RNA polymerase subunit beta', partial [Patescibacteria group bacterium]